MRPPFQVMAGVVAVLLVALALAPTPERPAAAARAALPDARDALTDEARERSFDWGGTGPADRALIEAAIAAARPEARRLVELVDGLTSVSVGRLSGNRLGEAASLGGSHAIRLDLKAAFARNAERGVRRLVLHELGHVIDAQLVPADLAARLDAAVPRGYATGVANTGAAANREERFAESFAKWALDDIGVDVYSGYAVPPPPLDWGAPLSVLP